MSADAMATASSQRLTATGELAVLQALIRPGQVVFDIGANVGDWTQAVLVHHRNVHLHVFEPIPQTFARLSRDLASFAGARTTLNQLALTNKIGEREFHHYVNDSSFSGFYRRSDPVFDNIAPPAIVTVSTTTLDRYCAEAGVRHIHFLKIDVEGAELEVLRGAQALLRHSRIDNIQFEYGGTYRDAGTKLADVFDLLRQYGYEIVRFGLDGLVRLNEWRDEFEDYRYANLLAIQERLLPGTNGRPRTLDLAALCLQHGIKPRGVIHIGAHEGAEAPRYRAMGIDKMLFVEANPVVFQRLVANLAGVPGAMAENCAISDKPGPIELHVTSADQSSSILPLGRHVEIYPGIIETGRIAVTAKTLNGLLAERNLAARDFNLMSLDIQGAELLALRGATAALGMIDAIVCEINFDELYQGCAQIEDIDDFLLARGFRRVATVCPFHQSWGDAFYLRR